MEQFLEAFSRPDTLKYSQNKWVGISLAGKTFTVHRKHGKNRKYPPPLVEALARKMGVLKEEFLAWYKR